MPALVALLIFGGVQDALGENVDAHKADLISRGLATPSGLLWWRWEIG